ncbi:MAG: DUF1501 domain-containing protein [Verrucomicrobiales bacterium]|nr:DUF1501 domain-containing protein [Verrucomicrobiales bacterium]
MKAQASSPETVQRTDKAALLGQTRRHFFERCGVGLGSIALSQMMAESAVNRSAEPMAPRHGHHRPKAKNVIFLFMAGGPSQLELFEDKPVLREHHGKLPPESLVAGKRFAFLPKGATLLGPQRTFGRYGECGMTIGDLLPHHRRIVDEVTWLRGMKTDVFNHGPAKLFMNSGFQVPGRPSMGSWVTYGLGSDSSDLPGFVVLQSGPRGPRAGNALWSAGFLPSSYQGVPFRGTGDPILNLASPKGIDATKQRDFVDVVGALNRERLGVTGDPEIATRIAAYEMAYRMQSSAPELMDLSGESQATLDLYGAKPGGNSYANNCLLARRLIERGVRFVQLYHTNWDHHGGPTENLKEHLPAVCRDVDQASAALVLDLKQRGLLEDTVVIWGGEFGRTPMGEVREGGSGGRDHHIDAFTMWVAGGGFKAGYIHGASDDFGYEVVEGKVHVHDLHATLLHQLGFDHERLTFRFQGRDFRLTDIHGHVVKDVLV